LEHAEAHAVEREARTVLPADTANTGTGCTVCKVARTARRSDAGHRPSGGPTWIGRIITAMAEPTSSPSPVSHAAAALGSRRALSLLINAGHLIDHLMLLIFATAVSSIASDFGFARWEDLMPYTLGAFVMFGLCSLPAGRLGDLWGRRPMMLVFFFGIGVSTALVGLSQNAWQMAGALTLMGVFAAVYHPVGIPMLVRDAKNAGITIGVNGLWGNLGIAVAAVSTGLLVQYVSWRAAFIAPGALSIACGIAFALLVPDEKGSPALRKTVKPIVVPKRQLVQVVALMTGTAIFGTIVFNFTTNGNLELLRERLSWLASQPAILGALLAFVYVIASISQLAVGTLLDRFNVRQVMVPVVALQVPLFLLAANTDGWAFYVVLTTLMVFVFGAIPFTDTMVVRFVDDRMRSRVTGTRFFIAFGVSSAVVGLLGPAVKAAGFTTMLYVMAVVACCTTAFALLLPNDPKPTEVAAAG
jgi:MFS family permease